MKYRNYPGCCRAPFLFHAHWLLHKIITNERLNQIRSNWFVIIPTCEICHPSRLLLLLFYLYSKLLIHQDYYYYYLYSKLLIHQDYYYYFTYTRNL